MEEFGDMVRDTLGVNLKSPLFAFDGLQTLLGEIVKSIHKQAMQIDALNHELMNKILFGSKTMSVLNFQIDALNLECTVKSERAELVFLREDILKLKESFESKSQSTQHAFLLAKLDILATKQTELEDKIQVRPTQEELTVVQKDLQKLSEQVGQSTTHREKLATSLSDVDEQVQGLARAVGAVEKQFTSVSHFFGAQIQGQTTPREIVHEALSPRSSSNEKLEKSASSKSLHKASETQLQKSPSASSLSSGKLEKSPSATQLSKSPSDAALNSLSKSVIVTPVESDGYTWKELCDKLNELEESILPQLEQHTNDILSLNREFSQVKSSLNLSTSKIHNVENAVMKNKQELYANLVRSESMLSMKLHRLEKTQSVADIAPPESPRTPDTSGASGDVPVTPRGTPGVAPQDQVISPAQTKPSIISPFTSPVVLSQPNIASSLLGNKTIASPVNNLLLSSASITPPSTLTPSSTNISSVFSMSPALSPRASRTPAIDLPTTASLAITSILSNSTGIQASTPVVPNSPPVFGTPATIPTNTLELQELQQTVQEIKTTIENLGKTNLAQIQEFIEQKALIPLDSTDQVKPSKTSAKPQQVIRLNPPQCGCEAAIQTLRKQLSSKAERSEVVQLRRFVDRTVSQHPATDSHSHMKRGSSLEITGDDFAAASKLPLYCLSCDKPVSTKAIPPSIPPIPALPHSPRSPALHDHSYPPPPPLPTSGVPSPRFSLRDTMRRYSQPRPTPTSTTPTDSTPPYIVGSDGRRYQADPTQPRTPPPAPPENK